MSEKPPEDRVRQLLLSGDNTLKNRSGPESVARARAKYEQAREIAAEAKIDGALRIIDARLADLLEGVGG
ncbi:MAG: hypothetical protein OEM67_07710 [Thermoleophilia bacterium]|nr:hypothetical protein [Thermoleophilia bacterium]MDH3724959.1 hypothetical protein [Thermoleophilia bacterium]